MAALHVQHAKQSLYLLAVFSMATDQLMLRSRGDHTTRTRRQQCTTFQSCLLFLDVHSLIFLQQVLIVNYLDSSYETYSGIIRGTTLSTYVVGTFQVFRNKLTC